MNYLRIYLSKTIHLIVWTLALAIGYTAVLIMVDKYMAADLSGSASLFYMKGLCFFIPLVIFEWSGKNVKRLWQFILIGMGTTYLLLIVLHSYLFVGICLHLWFVRLINRLEQVQGSLDGSHYLHLVALGVLFIIAGVWESEFIQKMTLYHFIIAGLLIFVEHGIERFESYVEIRKERANMPISRILNTGTRNLVVFAGIVLVILASVVKYQYTFVPVTFSLKPISYSDTREMEEETKKEESGDQMNLDELYGEENQNQWLSYIWIFLEKVLFIVLYAVTFYGVIRGIYLLITNFNKTQIDKNDVIESTVTKEDLIQKRAKRKQKMEELFDFGPDMMIRRKYKKELNKYNPQSWQTPREMEIMAQLHMEELHMQYEEVRYGKR